MIRKNLKLKLKLILEIIIISLFVLCIGVITGQATKEDSIKFSVKINTTNPPLNWGKKLKELSWRVKLTYPASVYENEVINYAYKISNSKNFLYTLRGENSLFTTDRRSSIIGSNGHWDRGICQLNYQWHKDFIDSPEFQDWKKQVDYCWNIFKDRPYRFYAYFKRDTQKQFFHFY